MSIFTLIYFLIFAALAAVVLTIISIGVDIRVLRLRKKEKKQKELELQSASIGGMGVTNIGVTNFPMEDEATIDSISKSVNSMMDGDK